MTSWAIDLGNTHTRVARWDGVTDRPALLELDAIRREPAPGETFESACLIPSAVHLIEQKDFLTRAGRWPLIRRHFFLGREAFIGRQALERNVTVSHPNFAFAFKPFLDREALKPIARSGGRGIPAREIARVFLRELLAEIHRSTGERIRDAVFTAPVEAYESYRAELLNIGRRLGISRMRFVDEPVAAAIGYGLVADRKKPVLIVDFGGGTFHVALVMLSPSAAGRGEAEVIAKAGRPVGGNLVDRWLLETVAGRFGWRLRDEGGNDEETFWWRLMLLEARRVKEGLFLRESEEIALTPPVALRRGPPPGTRSESTSVTRAELVALLETRGIYRMIAETIDDVLGVAAQRGIERSAVAEVLMIGGSTLLPGVYPAVEKIFGRDRVRAWRPFEAVAMGACVFGQGKMLQTDHIVHEYAILTHELGSGKARHLTIVPPGTRFPTPKNFWRRPFVPTCSLGEPETVFKLVICEIGRDHGAEMRFRWDAAGGLHDMAGGSASGDRSPLVVPLNESSPALGNLDPPHAPSDKRPRIDVAFSVNEDRWLCATVVDLITRKSLMKDEPVVRLL